MSKFITIEGNEGVGKSTAITFIDSYLTQRQVPHRLTREPGGTAFAEKIRDLLQSHHSEPVAYKTELLLFFAARSQHIEALIKPTLAAGSWVISDRFTDSSYAYQGAGRGLPVADIALLETWVQDGFQPDKTILLDAPVEITYARMQKRATLDRIEAEDKAFFERIRQCYLQRAKEFSDRYIMIDASVSLRNVEAQLRRALDALL